MNQDDPQLTPYSPLWPAVFDHEKRRLLDIFDQAVLVEHIGSTAVPGMGGRPIIDVLVGTPDLALVDARRERLEAEGYRHVPEFEKATPDRRYFSKLDRPPGKFALHAVLLDSPFWKRHLAFRDALCADPRLAGRYWRLKQRVAARARADRAAANDMKSEFIREVLEKARNDRR